MSDTPKRMISIYSEGTPNPETMKFVANKMLLMQNSVDFQNIEEAKGISDLAVSLFETFDFVKGVFISNNFLSIAKTADKEWLELIPNIKEFLKAYLDTDKSVVDKVALDSRSEAEEESNGEDDDLVKKIKDLLKTYVQPAVEMDGGAIVFKSFDEGIVTLGMQGACSGCPSSTITLKAGIEGMMKRMIPEVTEVVAEAM